MRDWLLAILIIGIEGVGACAYDRATNPPASTTRTTGAPEGVYGPGYSGTTSYGQTNGPQGEPTRGPIYARSDGGAGYHEQDQNGGDIRTDPLSR
jgi:hypothetical protein